MAAVAILSLLGGALAGMRFSFVALIPATILGIAEVALLGFLTGQAWATILLSIFFIVMALQFGYVAGVFIRASREPDMSLFSSMRSPSGENPERVADPFASE